MALTEIPQIHILGNDLCSTSHVNFIAVACKEAWDVFKGLELDYLEIRQRSSRGKVGPTREKDFRNYVNLDVDTFWLTDKEEGCIPFSIRPQCGTCSNKSGPVPRGASAWGVGTICPRITSRLFFPIQTLAIESSTWCNPEVDGDSGTLEILWRCRVQELLLIVGNSHPLPTPQTVFVEPTSACAREVGGKFMNATGSSWSRLANNLTLAMKDFQNRRAIERNAEIQNNGISLEDYTEDQYYVLLDLSQWKIPKIRLVEAKPAATQWIIPSDALVTYGE